MMQKLNYIRFGDYYIPNIRFPEENRTALCQNRRTDAVARTDEMR